MIMSNPFPEPVGDDREYMLKYIRDRIGSSQGLTFHCLLDHTENLIASGFRSRASAAGYYVYNVLSKQDGISETDKADIISGIREQIEEL